MGKPEDIINSRKRWDEYKKNYVQTHPEEYTSSRELDEWVRAQQAQGKIVDPFIGNWLDAEIKMARTGLIISMLLTALIKGQVVIWLILFIAYKCRVNKAKKDAMEADRKRGGRNK